MRAWVCAVALLVLAVGGMLRPSATFAQTPDVPASDPALRPHDGPIPYSQLIGHRSSPASAVARRKPVAQPAAARPGARSRPGVARAPARPAAAAPPPLRPGARLTPAQPIPPDQLESFVDGAVRQAMTADHLVGVGVSVVQNGQIVMQRGYGAARLSPARPVDPRTTLFRLGSVSKVFTWLAVLREVERGRMRLDRPVNDYLPADLQVAPEGFDRPVLLRHLPTHTAGFEDRQLGRLFVDDPARLHGQGAALAHDKPRRVRPPGELASYSNYGAALAGAAVAHVERRPFADLVEATLTGPLGLHRTSFREPYPARDGLAAPLAGGLAGDVATEYLWRNRRGWRGLPFEYGSDFAPAVAASSTPEDMARLMTALLNGGAPVLGPGGAQALRTPLQRTPAGLNGWPGGLMAYRLPGGFQGYGHDGATLGSRAALVVIPDLKLGVFVAANTDAAGPLTEGLAGRLVERFYAAPPAPPRPGLEDVAAARRALDGDYVSSMRAYHGPEGFVDRLSRLARVRVGEDGRVVVALAGRGRVFAPDGGSGRFKAVGGEEALVFAPAQGRAAAFTAASNRATYERVGWLHAPGLLLAVALTASAAALLSLAGVGLRFGREARRTPAQTAGSLLASLTALVWLVALGAYVAWRAEGRDAAAEMFHWPSARLIGASWAAVAATVLSLASAALLAAVWRGDRRIVGWSVGRKLRHTLTVAVFLVFAALLAAWGALEPWAA